jgi:protoheme IX farnesyltransferase
LAESAQRTGGEQIDPSLLDQTRRFQAVAESLPRSKRQKKRVRRQPTGWRAVVSDYITLTKPRIISLLLLTTLAAMFLAAREPLSPWLVIWTLVGGYFAAGGANALNMVIDRDVDALMGRTSRRPVPSSRITPVHALIFGIALNIAAFAVLYWAANLLTALLALIGSIYYVLIYTRLLKRTTTLNIVLGGAAGSVPPLVGWAAVTGEVSLMALCLFMIVFYWTPPHFWALALLRRADYARAGIPMLPVARGEVETKRQILLYSFLMLAVSILPSSVRLLGPIYLVLALVLGARFLQYAFRLFRESGTGSAWSLYKYSLLYLALLFGAMVLDHLVMLALQT